MISELWPDGPLLKEDPEVFRLGTDSVLLAHFTKGSLKKSSKRAAELGCGSGFISICLALANPEIVIDGIEINTRAAQLAVENVELNGLNGRINIIEGDLRQRRLLLQADVYDITVSNPPYYDTGTGVRSSKSGMASARGGECCSLGDVCDAAAYLTRNGGSFMLVHKPEKLPVIFRALNENGFEPKRLRFVQHKAMSPPSLVLIESRRGGKPSLWIEPPLILVNDDGSDTVEAKSIYRRA